MIDVNWFVAFAQVGMNCDVTSHISEFGFGQTGTAVYRTAQRITIARGERFALVSEIAGRLNLSESEVRTIGEELSRAGFLEKLRRLGSPEARGYRAVTPRGMVFALPR